jgi:endonuclease/exonuclease/phosphatase family metal-dependent hydrolase
MRFNPFIRHREVLGRDIREPTVLTILFTAAGVLALLALALVGLVAQPVLGYAGWVFVAVAGTMLLLIFGLWRWPKAETARQAWLIRILRLGRMQLLGVLPGWLFLIAWAALAPGGPDPPAKIDPVLIRVITWNIHCGQDQGLPWKRFDWPARKYALQAALDVAQPDILCLQEATADQLAFLDEALPGHRRGGVGRDDGKDGGEFCAIYYRTDRFELLREHTFWLEEPIDQPRLGGAFDVKRICTWLRLRDRALDRTLRVHNTHLYLTEAPRQEAARIILEQMAAGDPADAVLLTADFNAGPGAPSRQRFLDAGLADAAARAGKRVGEPTYHLYGLSVWCIDGILVDRHWAVPTFHVLDVKPNHTLPSDHFALLADLALRD